MESALYNIFKTSSALTFDVYKGHFKKPLQSSANAIESIYSKINLKLAVQFLATLKV